MTRNKALALIHIAKKDLGLHEEEYRSLLYGACGVESAGDITKPKEWEAVLEAMKKAGWKQGYKSKRERWGRASEKQQRKILAMWEERARNRSREALRAFIERTTGVSHERFLTEYLASDVIVGLEKMPVIRQ